MTAVAFSMTGAEAPVAGVQQTAPDEVGFALYVGMPGTAVADRALLADVARAVLAMVSDLAPGAAVESALALGAHGSTGELVAALREQLAGHSAGRPRPRTRTDSASERARAAWRTPSEAPRLCVDTAARQVTVDGLSVPMTFKELALLEYLLRSSHRAVGRDELLATVWRGAVPVEGTRTIDVHVRRLREKLGGCLEIVTVRGVGYRCDPTPETVLVGSGDAG